MSKPKNRIICPDCGKPKMVFESESKQKISLSSIVTILNLVVI